MAEPPVTPDGRYIVVRGRLWRRADPRLSEEARTAAVAALMAARRAVGVALKAGDRGALAEARASVNAAKVALGERGSPWWADSETLDRRMAKNTRYADWYAGLGSADGGG